MKKKGFTLVELLVVIAILAILATVSIVGYTQFIAKSKENVCLQESTQIRNLIIAEDINNDDFYVSGNVLVFNATKYSDSDFVTLTAGKYLVSDCDTQSAETTGYEKVGNVWYKAKTDAKVTTKTKDDVKSVNTNWETNVKAKMSTDLGDLKDKTFEYADGAGNSVIVYQAGEYYAVINMQSEIKPAKGTAPSSVTVGSVTYTKK